MIKALEIASLDFETPIEYNNKYMKYRHWFITSYF